MNSRILVLAPLLIIIGLWVYSIYKNRSDKKKVFRIIAATAGIIAALTVLLNIYGSSRMPFVSKASESYTMDINEVKKNSGTTIRLKKAFLDLKHVSASYSVWGKEKVVAVELKRNIDDIRPLKEMTGLWVGKRLVHDYASFGMPYDSDEVLNPIYVVFYLSNGQSVPFEIRDKTNVKEAVKVINIDKIIEYNSLSIKFTKFNKGLNWSWLDFEANFQPRDITVKLMVDGIEKEGSRNWSGGGDNYEGSFSFDPVNTDKTQIKIINSSLGREDIIDINIR